jgi:hypothetical protein
MTMADRLLEYADKLDRFKERYRYGGTAAPAQREAAARAKETLAWHEQMVVDLREAAAALARGRA